MKYLCTKTPLLCLTILCVSMSENIHAEIPPTLQLSTTNGCVIEWLDSTKSYALQHSYNLRDWGYIDTQNYSNSLVSFSYYNDTFVQSEFFRLEKIGQRRFVVVGDSISTPYKWPRNLETITGVHTFSQAIGGTTSPSMVLRAQGVELAYPIQGTDVIEPGKIELRWHRHIASRTHTESYRSWWAYYSKAVSEPDTLEIYQGTLFCGNATRVLKSFTTDYINYPTRISCKDHGLQNGDQVVFVSTDPLWPSDLSVTDSDSLWSFSSSTLPESIIERRVYFVNNAQSNYFEIKELQSDSSSLDIASDSVADNKIECGWFGEINYSGGDWDLQWRSRTKYDDWIWLLDVSANDIPRYDVNSVTIPNTEAILSRLIEINSKFIIVCPPSGCNPDKGSGSFNWTNYYDNYMPWVIANYPTNHLDTMALFDGMRTTKELSFLQDPEVPELLWLKGSPTDENTWVASTSTLEDASQKWVGSGYTPLQFRASFSDGIHLNATGNNALATALSELINQKGW